MKLFTKNMIILGFVVLLAVFPLYFAKDAEFGGADGEASEAIMELNADYTPWFESFWEPPKLNRCCLPCRLPSEADSSFII